MNIDCNYIVGMFRDEKEKKYRFRESSSQQRLASLNFFGMMNDISKVNEKKSKNEENMR